MLSLAAIALSVPLYFEPNRGQLPPAVRYRAVTRQGDVSLSETGISFRLRNGNTFRMVIPPTEPTGEEALRGASNYYSGSQASSRRTSVCHYGRIRFRGVFPGIDLVVYGGQSGLEYDWVVEPGADPASVRATVSGPARIDSSTGDLVVGYPGGEIRHRRPQIYQSKGRVRRKIDGEFAIRHNGQVGFRVGPWDRTAPLVIDPTIVLGGAFGGRGYTTDGPYQEYLDSASSVAVDRSGNIYLAGVAVSADFPLIRSFGPSPSRCFVQCNQSWTFISKLSPDGKALLYSTFLASGSRPPALMVDATGNVYVTGGASPSDFAQVGGGTAVGSGQEDAFLVKLDSGGRLIASFLFGGSRADAGTSIAATADGGLIVAGTTASADFPTTKGAFRATAQSSADAFLVKFNAAALAGNKVDPAAIVYATYLGPAASPVVAADAAGNAFVAAATTSAEWPTTSNAVQGRCAGASCSDIVIMKVDPSGSRLLYCTYFGGSEEETAGGIAVDNSGNAYVAGSTRSADLPTSSGALQSKFPNPLNGSAIFAAKVNPEGSRLAYSTYLGGSRPNYGRAVAVDASGNAYIAGSTAAADFPISQAVQVSPFNGPFPVRSGIHGQLIGYTYASVAGTLSVLNPTGGALVWSTYLGSGSAEAVVLDSGGAVYVGGTAIDLIDAPLAPSSSGRVGVLKISAEGAAVQFEANGLVNAASFHAGLPAPGGLASLFAHGVNITGTLTGAGAPLPTELAGFSIVVDGHAAPILSVSDVSSPNAPDTQQINFQVPFEVLPGLVAHSIEARYRGISTYAFPQSVAPGIFSLPNGTPAIQHSGDFTLVNSDRPASRGEVVVVYATGFGPVAQGPATGTPASGAARINSCLNFPVDVQFGSVSISRDNILYIGLTPGYVGLYQLNLRIPLDARTGEQDLTIEWNRCWGEFAPRNYSTSNTVRLLVK